METARIALHLLAKPTPDDLGFAVPRLLAPGGLRFVTPTSVTKDLCNPWPFAHVTLAQRQGLRSGYAALLADRVALTRPPVRVECPSVACAMCGIPAVERSAIEVARRGGLAVVQGLAWQPVNSPRLTGQLCPTCQEAV